MLIEELKLQNFIYNQPEAKCDFCKATENPHPDYDETIPITRIDIGKKIENYGQNIQFGQGRPPIKRFCEKFHQGDSNIFLIFFHYGQCLNILHLLLKIYDPTFLG